MSDVSSIPGLAGLRAQTNGDDNICVAILDGPVDHGHPAFDGAKFTRLDGPWREPELDGPTAAHGTMVASVLFGQPNGPVYGIAPGCRGLSVPVFSGHHPRTSQLDLARGIEFAVEAGAHVINVSGGQLSLSGEAEDALNRAVEYCRERNVLVVAAAGNDGCFCAHVPAALPSVLAVGALDDDGEPMALSNWGAAYQHNGILAPGADILGALPGGDTCRRSGTSLATPIVAGVAGLLLSLGLRHGREPDPLAVGAALLSSADPCEFDDVTVCARFLSGKLNIERAVAAVTTGNTKLDEDVEQQCGCGGGGTSAEACTCADAHEDPVPAPAQPPVPEPQLVAASAAIDRTVTASAEPVPERVRQLVYAIGTLGYDFGSEARRDAFKQQMPLHRVKGAYLGQLSKMTLYDATIVNATTTIQNGKRVITAGTIVEGIIDQIGDDRNVLIVDGRITAGTVDGGEIESEAGNQTVLRGTISGAALNDGFRAVEVVANPYDAMQMLRHLVGRPDEAKALIWTLNLELTPVYALEPLGSYGAEVHKEFIWNLAGQLIAELGRERVEAVLLSSVWSRDRVKQLWAKKERPPLIERFAVPGTLEANTTKLFSGQVVPTVAIEQPRGVAGWNIDKLIKKSLGSVLAQKNAEIQRQNESLPRGQRAAEQLSELPPETDNELRKRIRSFLNRIYYDMRNLGTTSHDRALNFSGTNAFQAVQILVEAQKSNRYALDSITAEKSPYSRADGDCWDIKLRFFDPKDLKVARKVWRYSVDVSDVMPVLVGELRNWDES